MDGSLVGQVLEERFLVESELGRGAMGIVYRARHVKLGRTVAIKVLHDHLVCEPRMLERFEREANLAARLHHANLVAVLDVGRTAGGAHFLVMELASGPSLTHIIAGGPLAPARAIDLAIQILRGLEHAHDAGLIHRDLKPDNIIIERDHGGEVPRIVDFGLAVLHDRDAARAPSAGGRTRGRLTTLGLVLGTAAYMAPEQAAGQPLDPSADLFALGVIMYEMLAGVRPFDASTTVELVLKNTLHAPPSLAERADVTVPLMLESFVQTLMARRRDRRFVTARSARAALTALAALAAQSVELRPAVLGADATPANLRTRTRRGTAASLAAAQLATGTSTHQEIVPDAALTEDAGPEVAPELEAEAMPPRPRVR